MIDVDTIPFDRSQMAGVNLYLFEETAPVTVYMDTLRLLAASG
ncbi:MAG TPA: hypothetical protein VIA06_06560 [Candidatus Dormibacteraeota bacterium]|jgi:hypothetical protein|nr:hypothetical protein [Candidatus Dormibacteraeota bacterium]